MIKFINKNLKLINRKRKLKIHFVSYIYNEKNEEEQKKLQ
jgi:hypothetical protein